MDEGLNTRIQRLYAALEHAFTEDLSSVGSIAFPGGAMLDLSGGLSEEELANRAHQAIALVGHLNYHLRKWAKEHGHDPLRIDDLISGCRPLQIIIDLANREKHGPPRDGDLGRSGLSPHLDRIRRSITVRGDHHLNLRFKLGKPGQIEMLPPEIVGDEAEGGLAITATIRDKDGHLLDDLHDVLREAVEAWEGLLRNFGIALPQTDASRLDPTRRIG